MAQDHKYQMYQDQCRTQKNGDITLSVLVDGVKCAGCVSKIEKNLNADQNIKSARVNFSTRRLSLTWQGGQAMAQDFVKQVENLGFGVRPYAPDLAEADLKAESDFLKSSLTVAGIVMVLVMTIPHVTQNIDKTWIHLLMGFITLPTVLYSGRVFFQSAGRALSKRQSNMDVPISLALILTCGMSFFETVNGGQYVYFDSAVMLMFFLLVGRYLDFKGRYKARSVATDLLGRLGGEVRVLLNEKTDKTEIKDVKDIEEGMYIRIAAGEKIPVDGYVHAGVAEIDTSLITGETLPRTVNKGGEVFAGTINLSAPITVQVARPSEDSVLADIIRLMEQAEQSKSNYVRLADRAAQLYTPVVHTVALCAFLGWVFLGGMPWQDALMIAVTVLIITCPCALGLAVPVVQVLATGRLMKENVLIKSGDALEKLNHVKTIFFDKTGTLTMGKPALEEGGKITKAQLKKAASLAQHSHHPLSKAVSDFYEDDVFKLEDVTEHTGQGMEARYKGKTIKLGKRSWCGDQAAKETGKLELWFAEEGKKPVCLTFDDPLRPDAKQVIRHFQKQGINTVLISGDRDAPVKSVAEKCGIEDYYAEQSPTDKYDHLERAKQDGQQVAMIGDGMNDAPVLAAADVSIAPGSGVHVAQNAADIVFMGEGVSPVSQVHQIAKQTQTLVKQNFALAVVYNILAVPMALAGFVTPMVAAIAMSGSSLVVISNSFRIYWGRKGK